MIRELYRVCAPDARVRILAPHPRHDDFINDPTHVRIITPVLLTLFDRQRNLQWIEAILPIRRSLSISTWILCSKVPKWPWSRTNHQKVVSGELSEEAVQTLLLERNNIGTEYNIVLRVRNEFV